MTITEIIENPNTQIKKLKPIKESMNINIPDIPDGISRRNGMIYLLVGSGGSGKTSLLLNQFKKGGAYHRKFDNIFYFCPTSSFMSVVKHPFLNHDKVYNELNYNTLLDLKKELETIKEDNEDDPLYNCVVIDDFANSLKEKDIQKALNSMLIKARHLNTAFIFTLQSYLYMPKILRKQLTYCTIFKPRNAEEWAGIREEILQMKEDDAKKLYDYVFDQPYQHLDVDTFEGKFYKNFNLLDIKRNTDI
jgi:hypothetical protein